MKHLVLKRSCCVKPERLSLWHHVTETRRRLKDRTFEQHVLKKTGQRTAFELLWFQKDNLGPPTESSVVGGVVRVDVCDLLTVQAAPLGLWAGGRQSFT